MIKYDENIQKVLEDDNCKLILAQVVMRAGEFWEKANCHDDFCIQTITEESIVFGSVNRVVWRPEDGFKIDEACCTDNFVQVNGDKA